VRRLLTAFCLVLLTHSIVGAQSEMVRWVNERLTVQADNVHLRTVFEEVARRTGIVLSGADRLGGHRSIDIREKPLAEALDVLLENVNFVVTRERGLFHLRVHSMTRAAAAGSPVVVPGLTDQTVTRKERLDTPLDLPAPKDDRELTEEEQQQQHEQEELATLEQLAGISADNRLPDISGLLQSDHTEVRIRTLHLLAARLEPDAVEHIASAFGDHEKDVVLTASDLLGTMPGAPPLDAIMAQFEPNTGSNLQFAALRSLALRGDVLTIPAVRRIVAEANPEVRELAARLLKALEEKAKATAKPQV